MTILYNELLQRFPEIGTRIDQGDEELPYVLMRHLVEWLKQLPGEALTLDITNRIVAFARWCENQQRTEDAGSDIYTILVVGFYEGMFDSEITRALLPKLLAREDIVANADYLRGWVRAENYDKALQQYGD